MKTLITEQEFSTQNLDSLGIVASLCGELGISDKINKKLYNNDKRRIVTPGKSVEASKWFRAIQQSALFNSSIF